MVSFTSLRLSGLEFPICPIVKRTSRVTPSKVDYSEREVNQQNFGGDLYLKYIAEVVALANCKLMISDHLLN